MRSATAKVMMRIRCSITRQTHHTRAVRAAPADASNRWRSQYSVAVSDATPEIPTFDALVARVEAEGLRPVAFQALWDGDSDGWGLSLAAVIRRGSRFAALFGQRPTYSAVGLAFLRFGGDWRLFTGAVPPWPEAQVGQRLGEQLARRYGVPFWFPSPNQPDDDGPDWWLRDRALRCRACEKPFLRDPDSHLSREYCYHCQLERERLEKLRRDEPSSPQGVTIVLGDGVADERILYTSDDTLATACAGDLDATEVHEALTRLVALGYATDDGERVRVTPPGRHL